MIHSNKKIDPSKELLSKIEDRWQKALLFFKKKKEVLFISDRYRFWEPPGFVQQSLANTLCEAGIAVTWLDGMHWKNLQRPASFNSSLLTVGQIKCLPGRRVNLIDSVSILWQARQIDRIIREKNPLIWVQGGLDERVCERIKNIDVYSVFDDPFLHNPRGPLGEKSHLILCQNDFSTELWKKSHPKKTEKYLPPVRLVTSFSTESQFKKILPEHFPQRIMGYLGAFFPEGFDFELLDQFVSRLTDWGFVLVGRTNLKGMERIEKLKRHPNFFHRPWIPREQISSMWQSLSVNLMLYRPCRENAGAFPVKYLESLQFRVPSVATRISKTEGLGKLIPLSSDAQELIKLATEEAQTERDLSKLFEEFFYEMHPKIYLAKIAEALS